MIDPGKFRQSVTFQRYNGTVDQYGDVRDDVDENWEDFKATRAAIDPLSGREFYAAEQSQSEVTHKIRCRYFRGLQAGMRIRCAAGKQYDCVAGRARSGISQIGSDPTEHKDDLQRLFHIVSVIDWEERHESFLIMAKELVK